MAGDPMDGRAVHDHPDEAEGPGGITRRRMVGYLLAAPTLMAGATWKAAPANAAPIPTVQMFDTYDLSDLLNQSTLPTADMISVTVGSDGIAWFDMPRAEVGQGITTACAVVIADELDLPLEKVRVTLADARPALLFNQFTGGSNTMHSIHEPLRRASATARARLLQVAAQELGVSEDSLRVRAGVIRAADGRRLTYGELAERAAVTETVVVQPRLKSRRELRATGGSHKRIDGRDIVVGKKRFAMDIEVKDAMPAMVCRPPTINGKAGAVRNLAAVKTMPGVTDVGIIEHTQHVQGGVAVRARTFGQCIDAVRALEVDWIAGPNDKRSDANVLADLEAAELPLTPPPPGTVLEHTFEFMFRPGDPLETNCAIADVRADRAEIWAALKSPIWAKQNIAEFLGIDENRVTVHVAEGGGSFGRHLFCDNAFEAAAVSKKFGKPVKLMWHRTDNFRHGRVHPMCTSRVRVVHSDSSVLAYDQRHTSVMTDFTQGLGEILLSMGASQPGGNFIGFSLGVFALTANVPYNFGVVSQQLNETYEFNTFNTSSVRNIYSPDVATATELMVDQTAKSMGKDPLAFRLEYAKDERTRAVLQKVADVGKWGRSLPAGVGQGIAVRNEYKGRCAMLVEVDTRPATVNRKIKHAFTGPRVTRAVVAVDVGLPINALGLEAQMMGGLMDGIAQTLTYSLHLKDGYFLEGSWDDAFYTRQWNTPPELEVIVMPPTTGVAGGAGELGCGTAMAATACAYARATNTLPTRFPINHDRRDLGFEVFPTQPPIPPAPTDGLVGVRPKKKAKKRPPRRRKRRPSTKAS